MKSRTSEERQTKGRLKVGLGNKEARDGMRGPQKEGRDKELGVRGRAPNKEGTGS